MCSISLLGFIVWLLVVFHLVHSDSDALPILTSSILVQTLSKMMQADDPMAAFAQPPQQQPSPATQQPQQQQTATQPTMAVNNNNNTNNNLPYSLYDVILDIPHPGISNGTSSNSTPTQIYYPPTTTNNEGIVNTISQQDLLSEFGPPTSTSTTTTSSQQTSAGIAKIARFAFPSYEDQTNASELSQYQQQKHKLQWNESNSNNLNKYDVYLEDVYSPPSVGSGSGNNGGEGYERSNSSGSNTATNYSGGQHSNTQSPLILPSTHVFSHKLSNGTVIHGHVRHYLPHHGKTTDKDTKRLDVGRRCVRALVLLTRNDGGGSRLYNGLLKCMEMIILQQQSCSGDNATAAEGSSRLQWFISSIHQEHLNLCRTINTALIEQQNQQGNNKKQRILSKPQILTIPLVEVGKGNGFYGNIDLIKFVIPPSFLHSRDTNSDNELDSAALSRNDIMPMLRCLGVQRTMRLLSALMSEKRIIFTSNNVSKLSAVSYGALSMLGQGLLVPPSVFVPILPPGLVSILSTPSPYVIGVLTGQTSNYINLRNVSSTIGEVVLFDLDSSSQQFNGEPYFHNMANPQRAVPDLTRRNVDDMDMASARMVSIADILYQDLTECVKADKKLFWQGAVQEKLGAAAAKGKKVASAAMKKGLKFIKSKTSKVDERETTERSSGEGGGGDGGGENDDNVDDDDQQQQQGEGILTKLVGKGNYAYEQGFSSEKSEEDARIAFSIFFVSLFGDIRTYMTQQTPGQPPVADKEKFMKYRASNGDMPGSGMFLLIGNFLRGKTFDAFVAARLKELQLRRPVSEDAPLFALVTNYHRLNKIDFSMNNVRQTVRQIATQDFPTRYLIDWNMKIRDKVSQLTSSQAFQGDFKRAVSQLTEDCHECSTILIDTMMVLWTPMQEGKGLQWKKALLTLQIFRSLLLYGPINVVAEAIDGFASIRIMKSYTEALRGQNSKLVRDVAVDIYSLIVDLPVLFARRRECMNVLRLAKDPKPSPLRKETRMIRGINQFRNVHTALRPPGVAAVAPAPPTPVGGVDLLNQGVATTSVVQSSPMPSTTSSVVPQPRNNYSNDLLSMSVAAPAHPTPQVTNKIPPSASQPGNYSNDLLAMSFASPSPQVGGATTNGSVSGGQAAPSSDAFNMQAMSQATPSVATPSVPPSQPTTSQPSAPVANIMSQPTPQTNMSQSAQSQPSFATSVPSMPMQPVQQPPFQPIMNQQPTMVTQPPMNPSFSMMNNSQVPPPAHPMQQQQQPMMKAPVMNQPPMNALPPMQGSYYQQSPSYPQQQGMMQQQPMAMNQMPQQQASTYPLMQQGVAPQYQQQGVMQPPQQPMSMNPYSQPQNAQKK